jgi:peptidoglycan hydrolase-like protein with peptidoglycan-binding domain
VALGWKLAAGAVALAAGGGVTGLALSGSDDDPRSGAPADTPADEQQATADVTRRNLARTEEIDGTVDFGGSHALVLGGAGMLTWLPAVGDVIGNGERIVEIDGRPVIAMVGAFPFWRTLNNDMEDGKDVVQLEYMLAALGYAETYDVEVDEEFTWETREAVEAFQEDHGLDDDGELELGELIVIDEPVRIGKVEGQLGQDAGAAGITVTRPNRTVQASVPIEDADLLDKGTVVDVELPAGETVDGTVVKIGAAETDAEGNVDVPVSFTVPGAKGLADGTPVTVTIVVAKSNGVLTVPVEAVLALAEGGYAVEVPNRGSSSTERDGASTHLVPVELGMFADGAVEIRGDIEAGTKVVVP